MAIHPSGTPTARLAAAAALSIALGLYPSTARAQQVGPAAPASSAIGERYHVEASGTLWNPTVSGFISSEQFGILGSDIDLVNDLGFQQTRFKDFSIVLRPAKKHRFRIQETPIEYMLTTTFHRNIVYNGQSYAVSAPVTADFGWKVWRLGYEYDFLYKPRGFVGVLMEGRYTEFTSSLATTGISEFTDAKGPLPAIGIVGRGYVLPDLALNFEVTGFKLPNVDTRYQAHYYDWNIYGTVNLNNYVGIQAGWRRMTTFIKVKKDLGDFKFQGMWFGGAVRY